MSTKCVLCRRACFAEHLSADLRVVCSRRVDEGGVGLRTIVSQHNGVRKKRLCSSLCSSPLVSMETDTDLHLSHCGEGRADSDRGKNEGNSGE